jgi:hypothetical protein
MAQCDQTTRRLLAIMQSSSGGVTYPTLQVH